MDASRRIAKRLAISLLAFVFTATWPLGSFAQQKSVMRVYTAGNGGTYTILCETRLALDDCKQETEILRTHLQAYPVSQLGAWTWVIIPADRWDELGKDLGLDSESPAYTCIEDRMTLIDESVLVQKDAPRSAELLRRFELPLPKLIDFAVTHEMGHALCGFKDEYKADAVGRRLREGKLPYCSLPDKVREKLPLTLQADVWGTRHQSLGNGGK
jgi:hypothetical protein